MAERWRSAFGFEKHYEVSSRGRVRRVQTGRILSANGARYLKVNLCVYGKRSTILVHRLIAETFLGPCPIGHEAAHLNGRNQDNRLENLAWKTHIDNENDKRVHGTLLTGARHQWAILTSEQVSEIRALPRRRRGGANDKGSMSADEIAERYGVCRNTILNIQRGDTYCD